MRRRGFLSTLGAGVAGSLVSTSGLAQQMKERPHGPLRIAAVEFVRVEGRRTAVTGINRQYQVQPLHMYDELRPPPYHETGPGKETTYTTSALYLKVRTDGGLEALYGPIDREAAIVVTEELAGFLKGKDALAVETLWDQMYRSNRHSRGGHFMMAISAVDNALWDLRGRYFGAPVYRLLGGPSRASVEAYGSCLGFSVEPDKAAARAAALKKEGFRFQKWFFAHGPGDGPAGMRKNVELVRVLRGAVGDEVELMFDAYSGWTLDYAIAWAREAAQYRPRWIEEAFPPDKIEAFAELRRFTSVPVASGEHFYGRWNVFHYLKADAISVVQADPEWCGGVSELVKICAVASLFDAQVIPHGHSLHAALHVVASQTPATCPLVEYLINKMQSYYFFEKHQLRPDAARIVLPVRPGFGIEFDPAHAEKQSAWKPS